MKKTAILLVLLQYTLPFLNIALIIWIILMNHAYVHPTSMPISYVLRSHGNFNFGIYTIVLSAVAVVIGLANVFVLYKLYTLKPDRWEDFKRNFTFYWCPRARLYIPVVVFFLLLVGSYGIISSLAFRKVFAKTAYKNACNGYALMAEIEVLQGFGYDGGNSSMVGPSSRVTFYKNGEESYTMDLIRHYRMGFGFNRYRRGSVERDRMSVIPGWGSVKMKLVEGVNEVGEPLYWNGGQSGMGGGWNGTIGIPIGRNTTTNGTIGGNRTVGNSTAGNSTSSGPIGIVVFDLMRSSWDATYTNTSVHKRGTFDVARNNLTFPELGLATAQGEEEWRFTDHVCLPPRVSLSNPLDVNATEDIRGEMSWDCRHYRICALKQSYHDETENDGWREWWDWVENVWPVVTGIVAWEVESYSSCCIMKE